MPKIKSTKKRGRPKGSTNRKWVSRGTQTYSSGGYVGRNIGFTALHHFKVRTGAGYGINHSAILNPITLNTANAYAQFNGWEFALTDLPNIVEFQVLFDSFCIDRVDIKFFPASNSSHWGESVQNVTTGVPRMISVIDLNDSTTPTTENALREYADSKRKYLDKEKKITVNNPRIQNMIYKTLVSTGYSVGKAKTFLDTASSHSVPHYGCKTAIISESQGTSTAEVKIDYELTYWFTCRRQR